MNKTMVTILGVVMLLIGAVGFVSPHLFGLHLSPFHNVVHLVSGALAVFFGTKGSLHATRMFCFVFGAVYGLLGIVGFIAGQTDSRMLTLIPGHFALGTVDHIVHVIIGAAFMLIGASIKQPVVIASGR
jgi:hypothetical protein